MLLFLSYKPKRAYTIHGQPPRLPHIVLFISDMGGILSCRTIPTV